VLPRGYLVKVTGCVPHRILRCRARTHNLKSPKMTAERTTTTTTTIKLHRCKQTLRRSSILFLKSNLIITIIPLYTADLLLLLPLVAQRNHNTRNPRAWQSRRVRFMVTRTLHSPFRFRLHTISIPVSTQRCVPFYLRTASVIMLSEGQSLLPRRTTIFCSHAVSQSRQVRSRLK
jgi:hypothetical protein